MRPLLVSTALLASFAFGCSSSDDPPPVGGKDSQVLAPPPSGQGFQLGFERKVASGTEVHVCREFVVPGSGVVQLSKLESQVPSSGTHHLLAYRTPKKAADVTDEVFDCGDVPGPIVYTRSADSIGAVWPEGVGIKAQGGEVLRLELHYLNLTADETSPEVRLNAWLADTLDAEAGSFFMYDRDIAIPAHGKFTARMHCEIPQDISILNILPHVHVHGVAERIHLDGGGLEKPELLVTTKGYGDQEARSFEDDPIVVKKGQSLDFECDYDNQTDEDVIEGPSKEHNEMCMILGDYYPKMDTPGEWCTVVGSGPIHDGASPCADAYQALQSGGNLDFASEKIMLDVCAAASPAWNDLGNCGFNNCSSVCPGPDCQACAAKTCTSEFLACQSAKCE
jgi:hypothetical protein